MSLIYRVHYPVLPAGYEAVQRGENEVWGMRAWRGTRTKESQLDRNIPLPKVRSKDLPRVRE